MRRACRYLPVNTDTRPTQPNALAATAASPPVGDDPLAGDRALEEDPPVEAVFGVEAIWPKGDPKPPAPTLPVRSDPATPRRASRRKLTRRRGRRRRRLAVAHPPASHPVRAQPRLERVTRRVLQHGHGDAKPTRAPILAGSEPGPASSPGSLYGACGSSPNPNSPTSMTCRGSMTPGRRVDSSTIGSHIIGRHVAGSAAANTSPSFGSHAHDGTPPRLAPGVCVGGSGVPRRVTWLPPPVGGPPVAPVACGVPLERGVALGGRGGGRSMRVRLARGSGRAVPSRLGRVHRAGAGWARGRAAEREGVGRGCGGRDAVGGVVPGGRARGSAGRVHRSTPAARSPFASTAPFPNATTTVTRIEPGRAWPGMR